MGGRRRTMFERHSAVAARTRISTILWAVDILAKNGVLKAGCKTFSCQKSTYGYVWYKNIVFDGGAF